MSHSDRGRSPPKGEAVRIAARWHPWHAPEGDLAGHADGWGSAAIRAHADGAVEADGGGPGVAVEDGADVGAEDEIAMDAFVADA